MIKGILVIIGLILFVFLLEVLFSIEIEDERISNFVKRLMIVVGCFIVIIVAMYIKTII